jgi:PleD family two-component response regulator
VLILTSDHSLEAKRDALEAGASDLLVKLKALETRRRETGGIPTPEEVELETRLRRWPRRGRFSPRWITR